jgi:large subunit ribosomal protein L21
MFAIIRTGGKQYRVAADQKIIVDRMPGEAGDTVTLGDILLIGEGDQLTPHAGKSVTAEIVSQFKGDKIIVFKKKRRHNYRRRNGHRQLHTLLKIVAIGDAPKAKKAAAPQAEAAPAVVEAAAAPAPKKTAKPKAAKAAPAAE